LAALRALLPTMVLRSRHTRRNRAQWCRLRFALTLGLRDRLKCCVAAAAFSLDPNEFCKADYAVTP
jgi:hypothetical protein